MKNEIQEQLVELNRLSKELDELYHSLAKHYHIQDSALWILYSLWESNEPCTQRDLSSLWSLSKQTINSTLKKLETAGYLRLEPLENNRKNKKIVLTAAGGKLAEQFIGPIFEAERTAFAGLTPKERTQFLHLYQKHLVLLRQETEKITGPRLP